MIWCQSICCFGDEVGSTSNTSFEDEGIKFLTEILEKSSHVFEIEISERVTKEVLEEFKARLTANKPKKGKKKGKKKNKKKGKKKK